jgi:hypothetical protein
VQNISDEVALRRQSDSALVMGSAPSVKILRRSNFSGIKIGIGDMPWRAPNFGPYDYWVTANTYYPLPWVKKHLRHLLRSGSKVLLSSASVVNYPHPVENLISDLGSPGRFSFFIYYDHQHIAPHSKDFSNLNCCLFREQLVRDEPIQVQLSRLVGKSHAAYGTGSTVALHGFALAVLLRSNPIYIAGVELPSKQSEYKAFRNFKRPDEILLRKFWRIFKQNFHFGNQEITDWPESVREQILDDFQAIADVAHSIGTEIFCLSSTSPLLKLNHIKFGKIPN